jgi:RNA polymerase sigma-70 factor (ECF subfamily)
MALQRFISDEWDKARALKRGGGTQTLPLPFASAETRFNLEPADQVTPEQSFERRWAVSLLEQVFNRLRREYLEEGNGQLFDDLNPCLVGDRTSLPYAQLAQKLSLTESAVKSAVHRLRQRYRKLLREEIAQTVAAPEEVEEELHHLFTVLGKKG